MLPTSVGAEPATSCSPVGRRIQLSHRGRLSKREVEEFIRHKWVNSDAAPNLHGGPLPYQWNTHNHKHHDKTKQRTQRQTEDRTQENHQQAPNGPVLHTRHMSQHMTKPAKWHVRPTKTQISLGIRPVWSKSLLFALRKLGSLSIHWVHSEDSDQTGWMPRLIWVLAGRTCHFVGFIMCRLIYIYHVCDKVTILIHLPCCYLWR